MWNGKKKAFTFSFDDGVTQDIRAVDILNKYGLKATFNVNSGLLGLVGELPNGASTVQHNKVEAHDIRAIYEGHEVAVHTLTHPNLTRLSAPTIVRQVEEDRKALSDLVGYDVIGMAYPGGGINHDERVAETIRKNTPIQYARTIISTGTFGLQKTNLFTFHPTTNWDHDRAIALAKAFLETESNESQLFYIWGHTYEFDMVDGEWERFEEFCKMIAGRETVYYGTNKEVLL